MIENKELKKELQNCNNFINNLIGEYCTGDYIFRGTSKIYSEDDDGVSSSLYIKLKEQSSKQNLDNTVAIEREIVSKARKYFSNNTSNIEILTDLRHYGREVSLIDFSKSLYVSLFFACNEDLDTDGELIILKKTEANTKIKKDIDYDKINTEEQIIEPSITQSSKIRVTSQHSIFVYTPRGYINNKKYDVKIIKKELKEGIIKILDKFHNIREDTIYNDLIGFINSNNICSSRYTDLYSELPTKNKDLNEKKIKDLDKSIEINPKDSYAYNNRGNINYSLKKYEEAIKDYDKAIEINPKYYNAYINRGNSRQSLGEYDMAIKDCDKAIEINPKNDMAYINRGNSKYSLGKYDEAIKDCDKAIEINPKCYNAYINRGNSRQSLGEYDMAIKDFDEAIEINPKDDDGYTNRGNSKYFSKKYEEAIKDYNKAIEINPKNDNAYTNRGASNHDLGRYEEAIKDYNKAIEINPKNGIAIKRRNNAQRDLINNDKK